MANPPSSVPANRHLSRAGLWATGPRQLTLPIEARGLSEVVVASGALRITPDYDVLAWLCERWLRRPTESGWMRPTLYELGSDLYGRPPGGADYRVVREALSRLAHVSLDLFGIDAETGGPNPDAIVEGEGLLVIQRTLSEPLAGTARPGIRLSEWLRREIDSGAPIRLPWRTLRAFDENHKLAKRLWVYLQAEDWKRCGDGTREGTWVACGDRIEAALGMEYSRPRDARAALKRACLTIRLVDGRYGAGALDVVRLGRSWRIHAERPTWQAWCAMRGEQERVRARLREQHKDWYRGASTKRLS